MSDEGDLYSTEDEEVNDSDTLQDSEESEEVDDSSSSHSSSSGGASRARDEIFSFRPEDVLSSIRNSTSDHLELSMNESDLVRNETDDLSQAALWVDFYCNLVTSFKQNSSITRVEVDERLINDLTRSEVQVLFARLADLPLMEEFLLTRREEVYSDMRAEIPSDCYMHLLTRKRNLKVFKVLNVCFGIERDIYKFAEALNQHRDSLQVVDLGTLHCHSSSTFNQGHDDADPIIDAMTKMPNLTSFHVRACMGSDLKISDLKLLALCRSPTLEHLSLNAIIDRRNFVVIAREMEDNKTLKTLNLNDNSLTQSILTRDTKVGSRLKSMLQENSTIEKITLEATGILRSERVEMDLITQLNKAGRRHLLDEKSSRKDCVNVLSNVSDDLDAIYYGLRLKPDICVLRPDEHEKITLREREKAFKEKQMNLERRQQDLEDERSSLNREKNEIEIQHRLLHGEPAAKRPLDGVAKANEGLESEPPQKKGRMWFQWWWK